MNKTAQGLMAAAVAMSFLAGHAMGQAATSPAAAGAEEKHSRKWAFSASAWGYFIPDDRKYLQPSFAADRGRLHLEGRYNYEGAETGSLWAGCNFSAGEKLAFEVTPMLGGVFGNQAGIAPGYKASLGYWKVELYSEGEYLFDLRDRSGNFFFNWSELSLSPVDWMRIGLAGQRTRAYKTDLDIQRGFLIGFSWKKIDFTAYVLNAGWTDPTVILAVGVEF
jgi:hypothetical protein